MHARGTAAHGEFVATGDISQHTKAKLMGAIFKGELSIARRLLQTECSANQANQVGQTPVMYAALFGRVELPDELKAEGANLKAQDIDGNTAEALARGEIRTRPARRLTRVRAVVRRPAAAAPHGSRVLASRPRRSAARG